MKKQLLILMMSCIAGTMSAQDGWQSLFNGKNLNCLLYTSDAADE